MTENLLQSIAGFEIRTRIAQNSVPSVHSNLLLNQLYLARGVKVPGELEPSLSALQSWTSMKGIDGAVDILVEARAQQKRILVIGDYDTDGATSTALAVLGLGEMGFAVDYLLPNRFEYGYGLSPEIVSLALTRNPDLIVTVDNGIASFAGVAKAKKAGVQVLITDHHLPAETVPEADAIVNPNQPGCSFQSKAACGCTVFYYLLIALRARLRDLGEIDLPNLGQWLDLVALATVADVVPLDENNRRLVHQGITRIRQGRCRPGIRALFEVAGRSWVNAKSSDMGFVVGPRLNAAGRLDDMTLGVQLLLTTNDEEARVLAAQLNDLNQERRQIEASMLHDVERDIDELVVDQSLFGCVVYGEDWHEGVIGILASRVKDRLHRPVVAFARSENGKLKGSARSVVGVHLRDSLDWITKQDSDLIDKFGGHAMAAGLTIDECNLALFKEKFNQAIKKFSDEDALTPHIWTDGQLSSESMSLDNAKLLEQAGPWGQSFPEPVFVGQWTVVEQKILAGKHLKLVILNEGNEIQGIAFNVDPSVWPTQQAEVRGVYQLSCNRYRGEESMQLIFTKIEPVS